MDEWMLLKEIGRVGLPLLLEINPYDGPRENSGGKKSGFCLRIRSFLIPQTLLLTSSGGFGASQKKGHQPLHPGSSPLHRKWQLPETDK